MRDRLIELIQDTFNKQFYERKRFNAGIAADYLLANGVTVLPCKVGDTVYVITDCSQIIMHFDNDYETGTGAIECPFEGVCKFEECNDTNTQVLETCVSFMFCDENDDWTFHCENINRTFYFNEIGKTVFLTREAEEDLLKKSRRKENE